MNKRILLIAGLLIILIGGYALFATRNNSDNNQIACTLEALVCPDGSTVGRSGPQCEFTACPNQDSFTGILRQKEGGFMLEMPMPDGWPGGTNVYNMPLKLKVTNALSEFINQNVTVRGKFTEGSTYEVSELSESAVQTKDTVEVGIGETKTINGFSITLNSVPGDYRCPIDAMCMEMGAITANVTYKVGAETKTFNMASDEVPQQFAGYKISIEQVKPSRIAAQEPDPKAYRVVFKIVR